MTGIRLNNPTGELASSTGIASSPSSASNPSSSELPKPDSTPQTSPSTNATSNPSTDPDKSTEATPDKPDPENWDLDDGGRLAIISPRSLMLVLSVTGRGAKLESLHLKPIPYRQNNAHVRSPYSIAILDASGKTLFRAPVEVDNLCIELGPDHFDDHCMGDIVYPHEAGAIFRIPPSSPRPRRSSSCARSSTSTPKSSSSLACL
jgi:hypothetical protein